MKKLIASAVVAVLAIVSVQAQTLAKDTRKEVKAEKKEAHKTSHKLEGKEVSSRAKDSFQSDFGNVENVTWLRGAQFDEATFTRDGQTRTAFYDYAAKLVGTTTSKKFTDLPAGAQKEIKNQYKGYVIGAVVMFDDNEANDTNMYFYGTQFEDADHYFVTVAKGTHEAILMVGLDGRVSYFRQVS